MKPIQCIRLSSGAWRFRYPCPYCGLFHTHHPNTHERKRGIVNRMAHCPSGTPLNPIGHSTGSYWIELGPEAVAASWAVLGFLVRAVSAVERERETA